MKIKQLIHTLALLSIIGVIGTMPIALTSLDSNAQQVQRTQTRPAARAALNPAVTAESLSEPGALQEYILDTFRKGEICYLPGGYIYIDAPIKLPRLHGGIIQGVGIPRQSQNGGWAIHPNTIQANTIIVAKDPTQPVFDIGFAVTTEFRNFGIDTTGIAFDYYQEHKGWPPVHLYLHRIHFFNCDKAMNAGRGTDLCVSDVVFNSCIFSNCNYGLVVNHNQGVLWTFQGQCYFYNVKQAVDMPRGGSLRFYGCAGHSTHKWVRIMQGGHNLGRSVIRDLKSDRGQEAPFPVIAETVPGVRLLVDGVDITTNSETNPEDWQPFIGPVTVVNPTLNYLGRR